MIEIADALALGGAERGRRIVLLAQRAHGRKLRGDVEHAVGANRDHGGTAGLRQPDPPDQGASGAVVWENVFGCECDHGCFQLPVEVFWHGSAGA